MARLSTYIIDTAVTLLDKIIGTDTASGNATKNFTTESLADLFNQTNKIGVADQATFKFQNNLSPIREVGTISFEVGGGDGTSFSSITTFMLSKKAAGGKTVEQFLQLFVDKNIILAELDAINNFGAYKVSSITTHPTEADFYNVNVTPTSSNGSISDNKYYIFSDFVTDIPSGLSFEGSWNASTDTPSLAGTTPANGVFYIVSVAGSTSLSGITDWEVGDWAVYVSNGAGADAWQKIDNTSTLSGSGTANKIAKWSGSNTLTDSTITNDGLNVGIGTTSPTQALHVFGNLRAQGAYYDSNNTPGTSGQILSSTASGTNWISSTDANTTYNLFGATSNVNEYAIALSGSDGSLDKVNLIPGSNITLTSSATGVTIDAADSDINGSGTANYITKWLDADTLADSIIIDNGSGVSIGSGGPQSGFMLDVNGKSVTRGDVYVLNSLIHFGINDFNINTSGLNDIKFRANNSETMRITSGGNVGIGTTSPGYKLEVAGKSYLSGGIQLNSGDEIDFGNSQQYITGVNSTSLTLATGGSATLTALNSGQIQINSYGSGTFTGTATQRLGVDTSGSVIEIPIGSGAVDGAGTTNFVTKWLDTDTVGDSVIFDNGTNVGIGTTSPFTIGGTAKLSVYASGPSTFGLSNTDAVYLRRYGVGQYQFQTTADGGNSGDLSLQSYGGNVGIGTISPSAKLQVAGGVQMADDTDTASADKVGTQRYREDSNNSYVDMCMKTANATYEWVNIVQNNW